jgi:hypothetical protein
MFLFYTEITFTNYQKILGSVGTCVVLLYPIGRHLKVFCYSKNVIGMCAYMYIYYTLFYTNFASSINHVTSGNLRGQRVS